MVEELLDEQLDQEVQMVDDYVFEDAPNKIQEEPNIKRHSPKSRRVWTALRDGGWTFLAAIKDWSAVFQKGQDFLVLHHFLDDKPDPRMMEQKSCFRWSQVMDDWSAAPLFTQLESLGFKIDLPQQAFLDAFTQEIRFGAVSSGLASPKHRLQAWCMAPDVTILVEVFLSFPFAPYGIREKFEWPDLQEAPTQLEWFEGLFAPAKRRRRPAAVNSGEELVLQEHIDPELMEYTDWAIDRIFREADIVVCAYSGGKDSQTLLLKCIRYKLEHPECKAELIAVSADTMVESPLLHAHVLKVREAIATLPIDIKFWIPEPDIENTYMVCVFGKSYAPPSQLNKYCVSRLKILPGREVLKDLALSGKKICQVIGMRESESTTRSASVQRHYGESFYGHHVAYQTIKTAAPLRYWTARDVVTYLVRYGTPWEDYSNYELLNLYGSAMEGGMAECPVGVAIGSENDAVSSCTGKGGSRFGCWSCTVVSNDDSLKNMSVDYPELEPYYEMRQLFKAAQDVRYGGFTAVQRKPRKGKPNRFEPGFGDLSGDLRSLLLNRMFDYGIRMKEEEALTIIRMVKMRAVSEGNPVTQRFWDAIYRFLPVHPGPFAGNMFDGVMDQVYALTDSGKKRLLRTHGLDRCTEADRKWIHRYDRVMSIAKTLGLGQIVRAVNQEEEEIWGTVGQIDRDEDGDPAYLTFKSVRIKDMNSDEMKRYESMEIHIACLTELELV